VSPGELTALAFGVAIAVWFVRRPGSTPRLARALLVASIALVFFALLSVGDWLLLVALACFVGSLVAVYVHARR
jgi:hypothetical protein